MCVSGYWNFSIAAEPTYTWGVLRDLRFAIGAFFVLLGLILIALPNEHAVLTTGPVNAEVGAAVIVFGALMLWLARRGSRRA